MTWIRPLPSINSQTIGRCVETGRLHGPHRSALSCDLLASWAGRADRGHSRASSQKSPGEALGAQGFGNGKVKRGRLGINPRRIADHPEGGL